MLSGALRPPVALTIAGSDPSGMAGLAADLRTFAAHEVYGAAAVTCLTVQGERGVRAVHSAPPDFVSAQIAGVFGELPVAAVKTGMLGSAGIVHAVADALRDHRPERLVVDPVLEATAGGRLLATDAIAVLLRRLVPMATLLTPNLPEARILAGGETEEPRLLARRLLDAGAAAVLIKGGHAAEGDSVSDWLGMGDEVEEIRRPRLRTPHTRGTGCTLSAAITARLARGVALEEAVRGARDWLQEAIASGYAPGVGAGPVHQFHAWWGRGEKGQ